MRRADEVPLASLALDRQADRRRDSTALLADPCARIVPIWRGRPLVLGGEGAPTALCQHQTDDPFLAQYGSSPVFLGDAGTGPVFATDVSLWRPDSGEVLDAGPGRTSAAVSAPTEAGWPDTARFADLRGLICALSGRDAEIAAAAKGILEWHRAHGFCAACGNPTTPTEGGWRRDCPACGRSHFPRTDPVVIMLVTAGNKVLLGRSPGWPEGFYSLLAGFMEPGETISAAVRREVAEEAGVRIGPVRLLTSQPWPFPASLMIGCTAFATSTKITLDPVEMDDALWIGREEMLTVFAGQHPRIRSPREGAIAHFLLKMWLADKLD